MGQPGSGDALSPQVEHIDLVGVSGGNETSKYPEEKKQFR